MSKHAMSKLLSLLMPILAATLAMMQDNSGNWVEVRSSHCRVITDANGEQGRRIATQFERMRTLLQDVYSESDPDPDSVVIVLAIEAQNLFRALQPGVYMS